MDTPFPERNKRIVEFVRRTVALRQTPNLLRGPTIGVEQELFLAGVNGAFAELRQSQEFFKTLATFPGWNIFSKRASEKFGTLLTRVSYENKNGTFSAVKYEFPPKLIEFALGHYADLNDLAADLEQVWTSIEKAAQRTGLELRCLSSVPAEPVSIDVQTAIDPQLPALHESRRKHYSDRGELVNEELASFPSYVAATQVHAGGFAWWENSAFINKLYSIEPYLIRQSHSLNSKSDSDILRSLNDRWTPYLTVFRGMRLLGFPDLQEWTLSAWINALTETKLVGSEHDSLGGKKIDELESVPTDDTFVDVFKRLRDLQIIKPKLTGTLEFRADPAVRNPDDIMAIAAMRLGQCLLAQSMPKPFDSFRASRKLWYSQISGESATAQKSSDVLSQINSLLKGRKLGEERFLSPLIRKDVPNLSNKKLCRGGA
ncbi:MAG: hypothetical protein HY074_13095 [Deltaproteobacteria bacterium]|nr:hypothetical protein [Deltaproteobacteria bacterium]